MAVTFFSDVRILDDDALSGPVCVTVTDELITGIVEGEARPPEGADVVVGNGRTLLPGLIDAHVHVAKRADLAALASHGVTTGIDMGSWPAATTAELRTEPHTTAILSAGVPFIGPAGPHSHFGMPPYAIVTDAAEAAAGVERRLADGSDFIKIVTEPANGGGPTPQVVAAIIAAAHRAGRLVVTHASHIDSFTMCVDAGADIITHVPTGTAVGDDLAARTPAAIPTLTTSKILTTVMPRPGADYETARASVQALRRAGVTIAAGTDAVDAPNLPFGIPLGSTLHGELALLVDAGWTPVEALRAATTIPAAMFGLSDRGAVAVGLRADLLLINCDPTTDINATRNIDGVWIGGERYKDGLVD